MSKKSDIFKKINTELIYKKYSVFGPLVNQEFLNRAKEEVFNLYENSPRKEGFKLNLDPLRNGSLNEDNLDELIHRWEPSSKIMINPGHNLETMWEIRQLKILPEIFLYILKEEYEFSEYGVEVELSDMRVFIESGSFTLPGQGIKKQSYKKIDKDNYNTIYRGIFAVTDTKFFFSNKSSDIGVIIIPAGYFLIYDTREYITEKKNTLMDPIIYYDVTYNIDSSITEKLYNDLECKKKHNKLNKGLYQSDIDKIKSYYSGVFPNIDSYGKKNSYMPSHWIRYTKLPLDFSNIIPKNYIKFRKSQDGKTYPVIKCPDNFNYIRPKLSCLGKSLIAGNKFDEITQRLNL